MPTLLRAMPHAVDKTLPPSPLNVYLQYYRLWGKCVAHSQCKNHEIYAPFSDQKWRKLSKKKSGHLKVIHINFVHPSKHFLCTLFTNLLLLLFSTTFFCYFFLLLFSITISAFSKTVFLLFSLLLIFWYFSY